MKRETFDPGDLQGRVEHALKVERFLTWLGWLVAMVGVVAVVVTLTLAITGSMGWQRALISAFGILAATVLSGATAYGSGTNIGLSAARLWESK
jgi:type IV secretory pathway VirB2 component (pilin)